MSQPENPHAVTPWRSGAMPHPAALLLLWMFLAAGLESLHVTALLVVGILLVVTALALSAWRLMTLLRRTRWVMFSLLLIYGYVTPGDPLWPVVGAFSPTLPGMTEGALQLSRLVFALAGLSIVLGLLDQRALMAGLYTLAWPLRLLGASRERVAVRLALTLNYAETAMLETAADWRGAMARMLAEPDETQQEVEVPVIPFRVRDAMLIAAGIFLLTVAVVL